MEQGVRNQVISGVGWRFMERLFARLATFAVSVIIARILSPEDFSVVSIVTIFFNLADIIIMGGLTGALIQKKNADAADFSSVLFSSVLLSLLFYLFFFFAAPAIASAYRMPPLVGIIRVMGLILPIDAAKAVVCAYISRSLRFKNFFFATIGGTVVSTFVGIKMALDGYGPWALVGQQMTNTGMDTLILFLTTRMPLSRRVSFSRLKDLYGFSWKLLVSGLFNWLYNAINPLVIGLRFSQADLAYYAKGKNMPSIISLLTEQTASTVIYPVFSRAQDEKERLLRYVRLYIRTTSYILFPAMLGLAAVARPFVTVLLTEKWLPAVPFITIFCFSSLFNLFDSGTASALNAIGRSDLDLKLNVIKKCAGYVAIFLFLVLSDSPVTLALSSVACMAVNILVDAPSLKKYIGYGYRSQAADVLPNLATALAMFCAVEAVGMAGRESDALLLLVQVLAGVAAYVLLSALTRNRSWIYLRSALRSWVEEKKARRKR